MASKKPAQQAQEPTDTIVIDITPKDVEAREVKLGDQSVSFNAPTANILAQKATLATNVPDSIVIDSPAMLAVANEELRTLKGTEKALDAMRESVSKPLYTAWENNNAIYRQPLAIVKDAIKRLSGKIVGWQELQYRLAMEEQRKRDADARAEQQRLADEAAEQAAAAGIAAAMGDEDLANELLAESDANELASAVVVAAPVEAPAKIAGTSIAYTYGAELPTTNADKIAAAKWLIANPQFVQLLDFDQKACNQLATALKENFAIPGIKLVKKPKVTVRGVGMGVPF